MLENNYYSVANALNYSMFREHFKAAVNPHEKLQDRIVHAYLALIELLPIIGQIFALFELVIVKGLQKEDVKPLIEKEVLSPDRDEGPKLSFASRFYPWNWSSNQLKLGLIVSLAIGIIVNPKIPFLDTLINKLDHLNEHLKREYLTDQNVDLTSKIDTVFSTISLNPTETEIKSLYPMRNFFVKVAANIIVFCSLRLLAQKLFEKKAKDNV